MIDRVEEKVDLFERHFGVLERVLEEEPIGITALSNETDIEMHRIRYSLRILEEEEIIEPTSEGAVPLDGASDSLSGVNARLDDIVGQLKAMKNVFQG